MNLNEYQKLTKETAIYPEEVKFAYLALGVNDEWVELVQKTEEGATKEAIIDELGDCWWYLARLSDELGIELDSLLGTLDAELDPDIGGIITSCIGKMQGRVKKYLRGDYKVSELSGKVLEYMEAIASGFEIMLGDYPLEDVVQRNYDKLMSRKDRDVLRGDGDNR